MSKSGLELCPYAHTELLNDIRALVSHTFYNINTWS